MVWIKNCVPSCSLDLYTTPYQIYFGKKPSLVRLHLFGCKAYVHVTKVDQTKLSECTTECVHIGFAEEKQAYLLYNCECQWVFDSHNMEFKEVEGMERVTIDSDDSDDGDGDGDGEVESGVLGDKFG